MKNKNLNKEERILQDKLKDLEFEFNEKKWKDFESRLNNHKSTTSINKWFVAASVMLLVTTSIYFVILDYIKQSDNKINNVEIVQEKQKKKEKSHSSREEIEDNLEINKDQILLEDEYEIEDFEEEIFFTSEDSILLESKEDNSSELTVELQEESSEEKFLDIEHISRIEINTSQEVCLYTTIDFSLKNKSAFKEVEWKIDGKRFSGEYKFFEPGKYTIIATVRNASKELKDTLILNFQEPMEWDFTYEQKEGIFNDFTVHFKTDARVSLTWYINNEEIVAQQPVYNFREEGLYDVTAVSKDENGCITEVYKPVAVLKDFEFYAEEAFTPNADGTNDVFLPPTLETIDYDYSLSVYNIKGKEVFSTNEKGVGWNGKLNNSGMAFPKGNYLWKVIVRNDEGLERMFSGTIKIVDFDR